MEGEFLVKFEEVYLEIYSKADTINSNVEGIPTFQIIDETPNSEI